MEYCCNKIVLRCLSEKDKKLIGIFVVNATNEYLHRCARLVYSALLAQNVLISTVFGYSLPRSPLRSEAIRRDILDLPFGTNERGEREKSCVAVLSKPTKGSRERTRVKPAKNAIFFSTNMEQEWHSNH